MCLLENYLIIYYWDILLLRLQKIVLMLENHFININIWINIYIYIII